MIFFFKVNNMKYWHPQLPFGQHISVFTLVLYKNNQPGSVIVGPLAGKQLFLLFPQRIRTHIVGVLYILNKMQTLTYNVTSIWVVKLQY